MVDGMRLPSLASIRAFEAAARLGNFASAGRELDMSAASVSYHVRQLERQLDLILFVRYPQRVELTEAGTLVSAEATKAFTSLRACFVRAASLDEARLTVTTLPSLGTSWLTPRLGRFRADNPAIAVSLELSAEPEELGTGRFDAAIRNGHGLWSGLRTTYLFPSIFLPLCRPELKAAAAAFIDPAAECPVPLLGRPDWWAIWYRALGVAEAPDPARFGTTFSAEHLDVAAALAGHGIVIASPILFRDEIEAGRLVPAHDAVASDGRSFWLACPLVRQQSAKLSRLREWLSAEAAEARRTSAREIEMAGRALEPAP
ncbi:MAG: LysR family transcriptional regulator [Sphingopyxis sp.]|nr:LysR family transcriptional regulator [Sphingopyxis sp.]